jgi:hypothetical protein
MTFGDETIKDGFTSKDLILCVKAWCVTQGDLRIAAH